MTKKTNSLLFRLGITSLWKIKKSNFICVYHLLRLEKILHCELLKQKWNILEIQWLNNKVIIQVYNNLNFSNKLKKDLFQYYKKIYSIRRLVEKFNLNYFFILINFTKKKNFFNWGINKYKIWKNKLFILFMRHLKLRIIKNILIIIKQFNWVLLNLVMKSLFSKKHLNMFNFLNLFNFTFTFSSDKLKLINSFIYFKIMSIYLMNILYFFINEYRNIFLNSIWNNKGIYFKYLSRHYYIYQLFVLCSLYNNSNIISNYIGIQLKKNKNHKKFIRQIIIVLELWWKIRKLNLQGVQLRLAGKLNGKMRKSKYSYKIGKIELHKIKVFLIHSLGLSYTSYGIISIKFWIFYGDKQI